MKDYPDRAALWRAKRAGIEVVEDAPQAKTKAPVEVDWDGLEEKAGIPEKEDGYQVDEAYNFIKRQDLVDVHNKINPTGYMARAGSKRESIMIRCPDPTHADDHPSAWINNEKNLWCCIRCEIGGDAFDLYAVSRGLNRDENFFQVKKELALLFGLDVTKTRVGGKEHYEITVPEPEPKHKHSFSTPDTGITPEEATEEKVSKLYLTPDTGEALEIPTLDWRSIIPEDTFLHSYLTATTVDTFAEEFHFWNGMVLIGLALGRQVMFEDDDPVGANLFICMVASTGGGKTKTGRPMRKVLARALPFKDDDPEHIGVKIVSDVGSAEDLVDQFDLEVEDPSKLGMSLPGKRKPPPGIKTPVRGLVAFGELQSIAAKANRPGSDLHQRMMQFYDLDEEVHASSRTAGHKWAKLPFASLYCTTQPDRIREQITSKELDSGWANRVTFVVGPEKPRRKRGTLIDIEPTVSPLKEIIAYASSSKLLTTSPEADKLWDEFFYRHIIPDQKADAEGDKLLVRMDLMFKKLMLLLAANKHEEVVSADTVNESKKIYKYLIECYRYIGAGIGLSERGILSDKVMALFNRKGTLNAREIFQGLSKRHRNREQINQALRDLMESGEIVQQEITKSKGGRQPLPKFSKTN